MSNHADLVSRVLAQRDAVKAGEGKPMPLSIKLEGDSCDKPEGIDAEISQALGREVSVKWQKRPEQVKVAKAVKEESDVIQELYEDAAKRGARTGD